MTTAEFARKYGMDRNLVYGASFDTPTRIATRSTKNIPEKEYVEAITNELTYRIQQHTAKIDELQGVIKRLKEKWAEEHGND